MESSNEPSHVSCTIKLIVDFPITPELQVSKTPPCCQITKCHCQSFIYIDTFQHNSISFSYVGSHHFKKLIATLFIHAEIIMKVFHLLFFFFLFKRFVCTSHVLQYNL